MGSNRGGGGSSLCGFPEVYDRLLCDADVALDGPSLISSSRALFMFLNHILRLVYYCLFGFFCCLAPLFYFQTLSKLLEEDLEQPMGSEEAEQEPEESLLTGVSEQSDAPSQWSRREGGPVSESTLLQRLFSDLLGSSRRFWGRSKKGLSWGCFGVKLDRIGAFSGLGC